MTKPESSELALRFAKRSVELLASDTNLCDQFAAAVRALRVQNGPKDVYDEMEAASADCVLLCKLLLEKGDRGDLIRSMAPFFAVLPERERLRILRSFERNS